MMYAFGLWLGMMAVLLDASLGNPEEESQAAPATVTRSSFTLPDGEVISPSQSLALSPDGTQLVYAAQRDGTRRLYLRPLDQLEARPIPGTEGGWAPFFSPDGQWVGFFDDFRQAKGKLKKWSLRDQEVVTICEVGEGKGGSWGEDETIIFAKLPGLWRVSSTGGTPEPLIPEGDYYYPQILPGGRGVLFLILDIGGVGTSIGVLSLETGQHSILVAGDGRARYLPTGHLVYGLGGSVLAAPFDLGSLKLRGPGVPVVDGVLLAGGVHSSFEVSQNGSLVYVPGSHMPSEDALVWVDRQGREEPLLKTQMQLYLSRLSPDGKRLAVQAKAEAGSHKFWTCEIERCVLSPLTTGIAPVWSRDSTELFFFRAGDIWRIAAGGSGEPERVFERKLNQLPYSISPDGVVVAFLESPEGEVKDLLTLRLDESSRVEPFQVTGFKVDHPVFSPDGSWVAFTSNRSGRDEIYVKSYPSKGRLIPITTEGGSRPLWSPDGREIFYRDGSKMMVVSIGTQPDLGVGKPRELFEGILPPVNLARQYDLTPDGRRFVMTKKGQQKSTPARSINLVLNWSEELKRLVPTGN